jgi:hypothetical protein
MPEVSEVAMPAPTAAPPVWDWRAAAGSARTAGAGGTTPGSAAAARAARVQGAIGGAVGLGIAAALALLLHRRGMAMVVAAVAVAVALCALVSPLGLYRGLRRALDRFGSWVGTVVTWLTMTLVFYLMFLPVGLILRAAGKLSLTRFADPSRATYWTPTDNRPHTADSYRKQF